jgi:hypothetical protein
MFNHAIREFQTVLTQQPSYHSAFANLVRNMDTVCNWSNRDARFKQLTNIIQEQLTRGEMSLVRPWHALSYPVSMSMLLGIAASFGRHTENNVRAAGLVPFTHGKYAPFSHGEQDSRGKDARIGAVEGTHTPSSMHDKSPHKSNDIGLTTAIDNNVKPMVEVRSRMVYPHSRRIRIAYVSYCFSSHPTLFLIGGIYALHDRERVHTHCYALIGDDGSDARNVLQNECETFVNVDQTPTGDVARMINDAGADVTINLGVCVYVCILCMLARM